MTPAQFLAAIRRLGFPSPYAAAGAIGVSRQQAYKLASGQSKVTGTMEALLEMYRRYGVPDDMLDSQK